MGGVCNRSERVVMDSAPGLYRRTNKAGEGGNGQIIEVVCTTRRCQRDCPIWLIFVRVCHGAGTRANFGHR